jgi:hypothetical protein
LQGINFDKVPPRRLLLKLHHSGVRSNTLSWIADFLSGRSQEVVLEGKYSAQYKMTSGVPQGTVLGPLLFGVVDDLKLLAVDIIICHDLITLVGDA